MQACRLRCPPTGPGSDYAQLSRTVKRAGLLRRRPVYYSLKIGLNLVLLAGQPTRNRLLTQPPPVRGPPLNRAMQKTPCGPRPRVGAY